MSRRVSEYLINLGVAVLSLAIFLMALEGLVRLTNLDGRILGDPFKGQGILSHLEPDPFLNWRGRPGMKIFDTPERINSRGLRGPEIPPKRRGVKRIAVLGDSCTFGIVRTSRLGVASPPSYAAQLQELLDQKAGKGRYEVINYGTIGYSTYHGLRILRKEVLRDGPDYVILRFGFNDHVASPLQQFFSNTRCAFREAMEDLVARSRALSLIFFYPGAPYTKGTPLPTRVPGHPIVWVTPDDYAWNLSRMIALSRAHGARPILLDAPVAPVTELMQAESVDFLRVTGYETLGQYLTVHDEYQAITERVAGEQGVTFLRTAVPPSQADSYFSRYDLAHPTAEGHARIARMLYEQLTRMENGLRK